MELFKLFGTIAIKNSDANKAIDETISKADNSRSLMDGTLKGNAIEVDSSKAVKDLSEIVVKADKTGKDIDKKLDTDVDIDVKSAKESLRDIGDKAKESEDAFKRTKTSYEETFKDKESVKEAKKGLKELTETIDKQESELSVLKNRYKDLYLGQGRSSDEAKKCAKEINDLSESLRENQKKLSNAETSVGKFDKSLGNAANSAEKTENRMSGAFKKIGGAVAAAFAVDKIKDFGQECVESAAAVKAENSQFEQTFGGLQTKADSVIGSVSKNSGILQTRLNTVGTSIYAFAKTTGMESTEALDMMERALQATADSAAYYDRSLEDTSESLKSFLKGNFENDAALGLSCTETTRNAAANELYGKSFVDLSESQKQLTLLKMVEDANKLSGAMGQASREADGWENVTGNLKESWRQFQAQVGAPVLQKLVPIVQKVTKGLSGMGEKLKAAKEWASEHKTAIKVLAGIFGTLTTAILAYNIAQHAAAIATGITTAATTAFGAVMSFVTSPITLIIAAIAALVAVGVLLYKNWDKVKEVAKKVWDKITGFVSNAWQKIKDVFGGIGDWFSEKFHAAWEGIKNAFSSVGEFFGGIWDTIKSKFTSIGTKIGDAVGGAFKSVINGILNFIEDKINGFFGFINGALDLINKIPGVNIPHIPDIDLPELEEGGILPKGKTGFLEGNGAEAVIPLDQNRAWTTQVAKQLAEMLPERKSTALENYSISNSSIKAEEQQKIVVSKLDKIISIISVFFPQLLEALDIQIIMDGDKLAIKLVPKINKKLGETVTLSERGLA